MGSDYSNHCFKEGSWLIEIDLGSYWIPIFAESASLERCISWFKWSCSEHITSIRLHNVLTGEIIPGEILC